MAIGKILDLSDKISARGNIWGWFWKKSKKRKNVSKKNLYCIVVWLKKYFFSKTKDEIDYSKCYKTISMPFSWYYIFFEHIQRDFGLHLPIIRIRIIKTKNSALKSDNAQMCVRLIVRTCATCYLYHRYYTCTVPDTCTHTVSRVLLVYMYVQVP